MKSSSIWGISDLTVTTFNWNGVGGKILYTPPATYAVTVGSYEIRKVPLTGSLMRAFWQFDTSSIPSGSTISLAEIQFISSDVQAPPNSTATNIRMGSFVGGSLDSGDWNGGTTLSLDMFYSGPDAWSDLSAGGIDATALVGVGAGAKTDIRLDDTSVSVNTTNYNFEKLKSKTQLRVTYTAPANKRLAILGVR